MQRPHQRVKKGKDDCRMWLIVFVIAAIERPVFALLHAHTHTQPDQLFPIYPPSFWW